MTFRKANVVLILSALVLSCRTVSSGTTQEIEITSHPSGANLSIAPDGITAITPATVRLRRRDNHRLELSSEGYKPVVTYLAPSVSSSMKWFDLNPVALILDRATGAQYDLVPANVDVRLESATGSAIGGSEFSGPFSAITIVNTGGAMLETRLDGDQFCSIGRKTFLKTKLVPGRHEIELRLRGGRRFGAHSFVASGDGETFVAITPWGGGARVESGTEPPGRFPHAYQELSGCP